MADEVRMIDGNALKEDFMNDYHNYMMESLRGNYHDTIRISEVIERIEDAPTIEAEPVKHGKWIEKKVIRMKWIPYDDDDVNPDDVDIECMTEQKCSYCKRWTIKFTYHIENDYCPLCGARMDGDSE